MQEIVKGASQADAYRRSYKAQNMSDNAIYREASLLLNARANPKIAQRLAEIRQEVVDETKWTVERLIDEFVAVKEKCMQAVPVYDQWGKETGEYKFDSAGANTALKNIGQLLGFYIVKNQNIGAVPVKIVDDIE